MALSLPSTPSEGEIVESDLEKATTSSHQVDSNQVDRQSRNRISVSRSPSPYWSPRRYHSRSPSRSPYRESRGAKRLREDDHDSEGRRDDPRRFRVKYENNSRGYTTRSSYNDLDRSRGETDSKLRYEDRGSYERTRGTRPRTRSRSPFRVKPGMSRSDSHKKMGRNDRADGYRRRQGSGKGRFESSNRLSREQSVSARGQTLVAAAPVKQDAKTKVNQTSLTAKPDQSNGTANLVDDAVAHDPQEAIQSGNEQPIDEAMLIEERRKKREAILAKHRGQATPTIVQDLVLEESNTPNDTVQPASPQKSPPVSVRDNLGQESPTTLEVLKDGNLANENAIASPQEDEPSAADYDPTMDMQEDQLRNNQRHQGDEVPSAMYDETNAVEQDVLLPKTALDTTTEHETKNDFDMFAEAEEIDMFAEAPAAAERSKPERESAKAVPLPQAKALDMSMLDDWDDPEGYYKVILGELLEGRYHVQSNLGRGMFSGVVRAMDHKTSRLVAIKMVRNNETMKKAGLKEIEILQTLSRSDPEDKKHIIRLDRFFEHKGHLCMVFENLNINLREVLKKFGRDVGINLKAVRAYAQQMFMGLGLLRKCNILHADLKPDNVLVNESRTLLKICDLGSASDASENEITPYLVSRFYRAPEIILGMPYDFGIDIWSVGCTLFELYTGKILFTGRSNNQMLRAIMECRGKFSHKILRKAQFVGLHFDDMLNFRSVEKDRLSGKDVVRILNFTKPSRDLKTRLLANAKGMDDVEAKELGLFIDLLDRCLSLNPEKRCTPTEALKHPFITRAKS